MPIPITVPRLGWSMDEGVFGEWLKKDGQWVAKGDMLFVLESDKAAQEIESFDEGTLAIPPGGPRGGERVKVGQTIGYLLASGESLPEIDLTPAAAPAAATAASSEAKQLDAPPRTAEPARHGVKSLSSAHGGPAARRRARQQGHGADHSSVAAAPARTTARPAPSAAATCSTPRARRVARELGVDWRSVAGSGAGGRVRERDVQQAARQGGASSAASSLRQIIARRMLESTQTTAPVTLTTRADAENLISLRRQFQSLAANNAANNSGAPQAAIVPSLTDLILKLTAWALGQHPQLNARWHEDECVVISRDIHLGLAVDTPAGLLVPVVRDAAQRDLRQLAATTRDLIQRAQDRRLKPDELTGSTFTITNLGMLGIDAFTPIINTGEAAVLGIGAIRREAVVLDDDRITPRSLMTLSLTFDHRIVDGAPAARFLQTLVQGIENPAALLI